MEFDKDRIWQTLREAMGNLTDDEKEAIESLVGKNFGKFVDSMAEFLGEFNALMEKCESILADAIDRGKDDRLIKKNIEKQNREFDLLVFGKAII